ncbi:Secondary metabolism regulator laeA [Colletotrichum trifolii]|uniref:Secondary metabolism regulator laeA n=1 Tax=Colletotrichum trifolii TaxID=5466 RepID=A0A4R8RF80_COLTR|nr:Secondary metabolism regulator laeA [Colletotrichum trifolii]
MSTAQDQAPTSPRSSRASPPSNAVNPIAADPAIEAQTEDEQEADTQSIHTSSTASLSESITEYRRVHGRTYTQKTDYWGPNDDRQNEGLEVNHYWITLYLGDKLFLAPNGDKAQMVLDVGTGTGIWAIDFADEFPSAKVIGVDVSPIQPSWCPPNCRFQIDDVEQSWTWPSEHFDFIHIRNLEGCIADWAKLYEQAFECMRPNGYIEVKEFDIELKSQLGPVDDGHPFKEWSRVMLEAMGKVGKVGLQCRDHGLAKSLKEAGFVDIVENKFSVPIGGWANDSLLKEVGACAFEFMNGSLEGFGTFLLTQVMKWEYTEAVVFISQFRAAIKDAKLQPLFDLHVVYTRKPEKTPRTASQD